MLLYTRIKSPTPLIWMLIWRFLSDTLMLFTTILWRAHFDSWVSATVDINCSLLCIILTQHKTATLIVHQRGKRGRLGETLWSSERSTSCSGVREASAQLPRLKPLSPLGINSPRGGTKVVHAHKYRSVYLRSQADNTLQHTHARVDTHELDGFLLYLGFSPW